MAQKDPGGDVIEDIEGDQLIKLIEESGSMAVYFCEYPSTFESFHQTYFQFKRNEEKKMIKIKLLILT